MYAAREMCYHKHERKCVVLLNCTSEFWWNSNSSGRLCERPSD